VVVVFSTTILLPRRSTLFPTRRSSDLIENLADAMQGGRSTAGIGALQVFSTQRACPVCATSYAELDPRLFSYNSKHGWCPDCVGDRKSTRLNSSHVKISYAVFCLKKKN